jgi:curved DNA-binding protein CbpA
MNQANANSTGAKSYPNYYLTLDIVPGASQNEILHAYNRAKKTYSTGSMAGYSLLEDGSTDNILEEIEKAFEILGNPSKRREYDMRMGFSTWTEDDMAAASSGAPSVTSKATNWAPAAEGEKRSRSGVVLEDVSYEPNPEFEKKIEGCTEISGAFLKAVRIYRNLTIEQVASRSKISVARIAAIEEDDFSGHQAVYLRGHFAIVSRVLGLPEPEKLAKDYVDRIRAEGKLRATSI